MSILIGHVLDQLRTLSDRSVHCVVTSPPYWGLRAYGTDPQVWGGDAGCQHAWQPVGIRHKGGPQGASGDRVDRDVSAQNAAQKINMGETCACGAWRGELGSEPTPDQFIANMVDIFREVRRVLRDDGTLWLNLGDSYSSGGRTTRQPDRINEPIGDAPRTLSGLPGKNLLGMPWRVALALQADCWYLRSDIIWSKVNAMPFSVKDRPSTAHEYIFLLSKSPRYYYDHVAVQVPVSGTAHSRGTGVHPKCQENRDSGVRANVSMSTAINGMVETRNLRTVWNIASAPYKGAHFATFPPRLIEPCILAGTSERGCCPHCGTPWRRLTTRERVPTRPGHHSKIRVPAGWNTTTGNGGHDTVAHQTEDLHRKVTGNRDPLRHVTRIVTTGWEPQCKCPEHEPGPCIVLDPFLGSGTTAMVAEYHRRWWVGIELSADYAAQAEQRIAAGYRPPKAKRAKVRRVRAERRLFEMEEV